VATSWDAYLPEVMLDVPGCPDSVAINAVKQAAIEFCNQSRIWREQLTDLSTAQGTPDYSLVGLVPADSEVLAVHKVQHDDLSKPLSTIAKQHLDRYRLTSTEEKPYYFNGDDPMTLRLYPTPDAVYTLLVWASLKPTRASTEGPEFLYNNWLEPIAHGAKARLKAMSRPWADKNMIKFHRREFINGWVEARIRDSKSHIQSGTAAVPRPFGIYRNRNWW
jgi:hypothetical protein